MLDKNTQNVLNSKLSFDSKTFYIDDEVFPQDSNNMPDSTISITEPPNTRSHSQCQERLKTLRQKMEQRDYEISMFYYVVY